MKYRKEKDTMGVVDVPKTRYCMQTVSINNFNIGKTLSMPFRNNICICIS